MASGLAWKRLSPRWRELGLASSRMVKLACSLGTREQALRGRARECAETTCQPQPAPRASGGLETLIHLIKLPSAYCVPKICRW